MGKGTQSRSRHRSPASGENLCRALDETWVETRHRESDKSKGREWAPSIVHEQESRVRTERRMGEGTDGQRDWPEDDGISLHEIGPAFFQPSRSNKVLGW